ncbi:hypothetical protein P691DRAFT_775853 [Macrolepiota fuliginosa MF-IS2]|uniref:Uncharacterized protein n=1 Tax=Macrolepiota fuliginosa MF-IS2 TaxID=1400762 RepID=A0A9P5XB72_9AGAR|nr:hypothetical protein P691DRAFT_775853 [Macrolepiota fuliginosa MF-IS2]
MYSFLPDELLKEILTPALQISDKSFSSTGRQSPFAKYERSTSAYLLVCKDWLRVGTPLLYNVVVLRSKPQIQALARALKLMPNLGNFIKKLRIECSYSAYLLKVMRAAGNLTDLCLSFEIYAQDNVSGLCKGLTSIQPRRVILYDPISSSRGIIINRHVLQLGEALVNMIPKWTYLKTFVLPSWHYFLSELGNIYLSLIKNLCQSKGLEEVSLLGTEDCHVLRLAKVPSIKRIIVHDYHHRSNVDKCAIIAQRPELAGIVAVIENCQGRASDSTSDLSLTPTPPPSPSLPSSLPQDWFQNCPGTILENILLHALAIPQLQETCYRDCQKPWLTSFSLDDRCGSPTFRRGLALVCKKFHETVIPLYYQCIIFLHTEDISMLVRCYESRPELGHYTRSLFISPSLRPLDRPDNNLAFIFSCSPNLQRVACFHEAHREWYCLSENLFSWKTVMTLAAERSDQLVDLEIQFSEPRVMKDPVLCKFTHLRYLSWYCNVSFSIDPATIPKSGLCSLEVLACICESNALFELLSFMDLPHLHTICFTRWQPGTRVIPFFQKHGPKLLNLETQALPTFKLFDMCGNLKRFILHDSHGYYNYVYVPPATVLAYSQIHPLEEIEFRELHNWQEYFDFLGLLDLSPFKSLRRFQVHQCTWPVTERDIKKSLWVFWAERLTNLYGISMLDGEGKAWTSRLKSGKGRK